MNRRTMIMIGGAIGAIIVLAVGWYLVSPLFFDNAVDEAFPFDLPTEAEADDMSPEEIEKAVMDAMEEISAEGAMDDMTDEEMETVEDRMMELSAEMPDNETEEDMPESADAWIVAGSGEFRDADRFHTGSGTATIFQQGDQSVLRFEDFEVTNGPDLHVLLVENPDATNQDEIGEYVDLGSLKGNIGNQNYEIPSDIDLSQYSGVMIYCQPFHVVFATAPLAP